MAMPPHTALLSLLVVSTTLLTTVSSFSSGALPSSCANLDPSGHGASTATGPAPYTLELSSTDYLPGDNVQVTLRGVSGAQFKGFLAAGRRAGGQSTDNIGQFGVIENGKAKTICDQPLGNALTHTEAAPKDSATFSWTAPSTAQGDVVIHYTVVRGGAPGPGSNPADYFQDLRSAVITGPPLAAAKPASFNRDPECGVTKGCYSDCLGSTCGWEVTWQESGDVYNISLRSVFGTDNKYVAVGFSTQSAMAQASVVACVTSGGQVKVAGSYNPPGYSNVPLADPSAGISNQQTSFADGVLSCTFSREKLSSDPHMFNLTEHWYIITARGDTDTSGTLQQHDPANRFHTAAKVDLTATNTDEKFVTKHTTTTPDPTRTTVPSDTRFPKDPACGKSKGCYSDCDDQKCALQMTWYPSNSTHFRFSIEAVYTGTQDYYVALGFSTSDKMAEASVMACTHIAGVVDVFASFNPGYYNQPLQDPKEGISDIEGTFDAGIMKCTFTRVKELASNSQIFALAKPWHLIVAFGGAMAGGVLLEHNNKDRFVTSSSIDFNDLTTDISLEELDYPLIQAHAILMIIAWMVSGSLGLAFARFFKKNWPNRTLCGVKVWFAVHRFCMILVFVMALVAILLVFLEIEGYSEIHGETYKKAHPVLGLITTGLMFINPFMSLLRCGHDHPQRWVFNWSHWAVGTSAHILAGVTISLGMYLPKAQMDKDPGLLTMILYGVWHVIFGVTCGVLDYLAAREEPYSKASEINSNTNLIVDPIKAEEPPKSGAKKFMLFLHAVILTLMSAFLVYLVLDGE